MRFRRLQRLPIAYGWATHEPIEPRIMRFPRAHGRRLAELLPQGRFELVERSRTFIPEDNPARLVELLRGWGLH
jgi:hypothetical protein